MGMFDYVKYEEQPCLRCGSMLKEYQTKDSGCAMETIDPWQCQSFYDYCKNCKTMNYFKVEIIGVPTFEVTRETPDV